MDISQLINENQEETKYENAITLCYFEKDLDYINNYLNDLLEKCKKISNSIKRKKLNDSIYLLINKIQDIYYPNQLYLIIDSNIKYYNINDSYLEIYKQYKIQNPFYKTSECFELDFFKDYFFNHNFYTIVNIENNYISIRKITKSKDYNIKKDFNEKNLEFLLEELKNQSIYPLYYINTTSKNYSYLNKYIDIKKWIDKNHFFQEIKNNELKKNNELLQLRLNELKKANNIDKYVFGKLKYEFKYHIENFLLKELFIEEKKLIKLKEIINDNTYFNFNIYIIKSFEKDDLPSQFISDYNGIIGIKYY